MRAIIIAAGMGSRLEHHTEERPKCMVEVAGRSILSYQLEALRAHGVDDIHIVRGYLSEKLVVDGATYWENPDFRNNNILLSLFCAEPAMQGAFVTTYSDIVYGPEVVHKLMESPDDVALVVDRRWHEAYEGREDHPPEQAELTVVSGDRVTAVGKHVSQDDNPLGEFIGLAKFSAEGGRWLRETYQRVRSTHGDDDPFQAAPRFRKAYQTDLIEEMIRDGHPVGYIPIDGSWREIDTVEDLARVSQWPLTIGS